MNLLVQLSFLMLRHFKDFPQPCSWGICWAFGSSQGLIWKITPFKRSIGIIPHINTQPHSKIVLSLFEIFSSSTHKYFQEGFFKTFPEQILFSVLFFFVDIPQKAVYIYRTVYLRAFSFHHFSQSLAICLPICSCASFAQFLLSSAVSTA